MAQRYEITDAVMKTVTLGGAVAVFQSGAGASAQIKDLQGNNLTIYQAETGGSTFANPLSVDSAGRIEGWVDAPDFDIAISGTGITTYTQKIRQSPQGTYNVKSYGATGNGTTNDTTAVQAALTAATTAGGGTVHLPLGTYLVTTALTIGSNTTIRGAGWGSQITVGGSAHDANSIDGLKSTSTSRVTIESLRLVGPESGAMTTANGTDTGKGIKFDTVTDYVIRDVHISRFNIQGIYVGVGVRGKITGCTVMEMWSGNGISLDGLSIDNVIEGNTLKDIADCGFGIHNGAINTVVADNVVNNTNFGRGVDVFGAPDTIVTGNVLRSIGGSGASGRGIQLSIGTGSTSPIRCQIVGNSIYAADDEGILIDGGSTGITDTVISDNTILSCSGRGIYIAQSVTRVTITGNQINSNSLNGVYLEHSGGNIPAGVFIDGNVIRGHSSTAVKWTASVVDLRFGKNDLSGNSVQPCDGAAPTVASTAALALPAHSGFVNVTGTTNITSVGTGAQAEVVTLCFAGALTFTDGSNLKLAGNFVTTADDTITLVCDGAATWYEVCRSVN